MTLPKVQGRLWLAVSCVIYAAPSFAQALNGHAQHLTPHRAPHAVPASTAPEAAQEAAEGTAYSGTPVDVLTYHYDNNRTGWNPAETDLTPATVASGKFKQIAILKVNGNVLAQPLLVSNFQMPDGSVHNLLIVPTGHNNIYAYDAKTGAPIWQRIKAAWQRSNS